MKSSATDDVRRLVDGWAAAVRARDVSRVLAHHSNDILLFDVTGPICTRGLEPYRHAWEGFFSWSRGQDSFELSDIVVTADESMAFVTSLIHCVGFEHGSDASVTVRLTMCLVRDGDQWVVLHEHHSEALPP